MARNTVNTQAFMCTPHVPAVIVQVEQTSWPLLPLQLYIWISRSFLVHVLKLSSHPFTGVNSMFSFKSISSALS